MSKFNKKFKGRQLNIVSNEASFVSTLYKVINEFKPTVFFDSIGGAVASHTFNLMRDESKLIC